jgi:hypothetical protein
MSHGLALTGVGVLLGTATALGTTRLLGNLLYRVSPRDPLAFGSALVVMALASVVACILPASRTARTDPGRAVRDGRSRGCVFFDLVRCRGAPSWFRIYYSTLDPTNPRACQYSQHA